MVVEELLQLLVDKVDGDLLRHLVRQGDEETERRPTSNPLYSKISNPAMSSTAQKLAFVRVWGHSE